MRISDWSSDVCSSDLRRTRHCRRREPSMIDVYFTPTPNGHKVSIMLEETGLPHQLLAMNMLEGDHLTPEYRRINPNGRLPAIVDHEPIGGGEIGRAHV